MVPYVIRNGRTHRHGTICYQEGTDTQSWYHVLLERDGHIVMIAGVVRPIRTHNNDTGSYE